MSNSECSKTCISVQKTEEYVKLRRMQPEKNCGDIVRVNQKPEVGETMQNLFITKNCLTMKKKDGIYIIIRGLYDFEFKWRNNMYR